MVPCIVTSVRERDGYNVGVETHHKFVSAHQPSEDFAIDIALNSRQCELVTFNETSDLEGDGVSGD